MERGSYYREKLAGEALERCYQVGSARVQRYLRAEMDFVVAHVHPGDVVLDLGCGYGRTLADLAGAARLVVGIDTSPESLALAAARLRSLPNLLLACMDAARLAFVDATFDVVVCVQNGIAAFGVDRRALVHEAWRVLRPGGLAIFSSYSDKFWDDRLAWFEAQAAAGLIGSIDRRRSGGGVIVCSDGLVLGAVRPEEFAPLVAGLDAEVASVEVDGSCWFHLLRRPDAGAGGGRPGSQPIA